ncbi:sulfurtransferase complex subunit TusB [Buchnera aphidicola]|uniref:sulfurtransferase complex subunit TusB n=1 Tax=Buchnera aphidicola TaxID=9 RepID=UPI0020926275|nr:sulfurtransferase complex subunit TusB [Buchnera aphidicola]USS94091.1 sulfurtransferase complex subunit TusB [Buchnera aphidicola (Sipha maydis)]WII23636.1 sulfurtransferase complex subunit TusB [Buchnera aphidicola (Sipha maydis)]
MLHILINTPFKSDIRLLIKSLTKRDDLIVIQDGVIFSIKQNIFLKKVFLNTRKNYVLLNDLIIRGINITDISKIFIPINYQGFVKLTEHHKNQLIW